MFMTNEICKKVDCELTDCLDKLGTLEPETEEYRKTLEAAKLLHSLSLEANKVELDQQAKTEKSKQDNERAEADRKSRRWEFWIEKGLAVGSLVANLAFFGFQWTRGLYFEQKGTLTSPTFREIRQKTPKFLKD